MAKETRALARRVRKSARKAAPKTLPDKSNPKSSTKASGGKKPPMPNCVPIQRTYSPELLASGRHRYENTPEPAASIAADFGILPDSLHRMARRHGWVPYKMGPRELPAAARLLARAEQLEEASCPSPRLRGEGGEHRAHARCEPGEGAPPTTEDVESPPHPISSRRLSSGRASRGPVGSEIDPRSSRGLALSPQAGRGDGGESLAAMIEQIEREVRHELGKVSALREQLKGVPPRPRDAQTTARTLSTLTETLEKLQRLRLAQPARSGPAYDDMPADIDQFRDELARRIRAFVAARRGGGGSGECPASPSP